MEVAHGSVWDGQEGDHCFPVNIGQSYLSQGADQHSTAVQFKVDYL